MEEGYFCWLWLIISYTLMYLLLKVLVYFWWRPRRIQLHFFKQGIKGPQYNFLLGNTKEIVGLMLKASSNPMPLSHNILPRVLSFYHHWNKIYGGTFLVWFGSTARLTISDPVLIREVLNLKSDLFEKTEPPPHVRKLEGDGLLTLKGEKWVHHRKIIAPAFYPHNIKLMVPIMGKSMGKMLDKWVEISNSGRVEIEVSKWFQILTEEIITYTAFGSSFEDGKAIFKLQAQQMVCALGSYNQVLIPVFRFFETGHGFLISIQGGDGSWRLLSVWKKRQGLEAIMVKSVPDPSRYHRYLHGFLPTKKNRLSWRLDKEIKKSLKNLIHKRIKAYTITSKKLEKSDESPKDLLELMIKESMKETNGGGERGRRESISSFKYSSESSMSVEDIVEECKTMFFAGKHTTSALLTWSTILLAMHPHWQQVAREEVLSAASGSPDFPTKLDVSKFKTLGMILYESLRLYPPVVAILRRAKLDVELGGCKIPRGTEILLPILAVHHDRSLWGHDATEFNPARFARDMAHAAKHPTAFMPFGLGGRRCVGLNLAILQAKLAIAMILQRFSFALAPSYQHAPTVEMLLNPQYGAPIMFRKL